MGSSRGRPEPSGAVEGPRCLSHPQTTTTQPNKLPNHTQKQELESPTELAVYEALLEACAEQRAVVGLTPEEEEELRGAANNKQAAAYSPSSGAAAGSAQARLLTLAFRREKARVLDEAIARFARLTGKAAGGSSSGKAAAPAAETDS